MSPLNLANRVYETTTTVSTGPYLMNGAVTGYRTWADAFPGPGVTEEVPYIAYDPSGAFEIGVGTWDPATNSLSRDTIKDSSTGSIID